LTPDYATGKIVGMRARAVILFLGLVGLLMVSDFVFRSIVPAFEPSKTDFSELYTSAWLWRHGQNPYDPSLATEAQTRVVGVSVQISPIYPLSTFALVSPFTFLDWGWANLVWLLLGLGGVAATIFLLLRLRGPCAWGLQTTAFITFLLSFDPLHQAFHLGNIALLVVPLSLWAVVLAEQEREEWAGLILGLAACLKPQIGVWILAYYLLRGRRRLLIAALAVAAIVTVILLLRPIPWLSAVNSYRANLQHWFAPGRPYGFTEGSLAFHVNITQVIIYRLSHSVLASNLIAHALFLTGVALWTVILWRARFCLPSSLGISSLLALSFLSLYHSVSDATILTLVLCWAFPSESQPWTRPRILTCVLLLLMMLPGHSLLMRLSPHLSPSVTTAWWWNLFVARYFVWLLLGLNVALLMGLSESAHSTAEAGSKGAAGPFVPSAPGRN
jgi:hypothetical protein